MTKLTNLFALSILTLSVSANALVADLISESFDGGVIGSHNGTTVVWSDGGDAPWYGPGTNSLLPGDYYESGNINDNQISSLFVTVEIGAAGGVVGTDYSVSSETSFDFFELWINGSNVFSDSGTNSGNTGAFALLPGSNLIEFRFDKDGSVSVAADAAGIDNVRITNVVPEPASALLLSGLAGLFGITLRRRSNL